MVNLLSFVQWISVGIKELPYFDLPKEMNPFWVTVLLRISISETGNQMFRTQLRALLRASVHGRIADHVPNGCFVDRVPYS